LTAVTSFSTEESRFNSHFGLAFDAAENLYTAGATAAAAESTGPL
jgi:hypothetical protein